jgi:SAM-dependent methyltransferase
MDSYTPDIFEVAFADYYFTGKKDATLKIINNKGDDEFVPVSYFFRSFDEMPEIEKIALNLCQGKILDVGAGSGCHSLVLQKMDFEVTALDIRKTFVGIMKERGIKKTLIADFYHLIDRRYDTILMLMNGIGFTGDLMGLERFLEHSKELLTDDGQILFDSTDLMYIYKEKDGSIRIDLNESYYGEVEYIFEYEGQIGKPFKWLFIDFFTLQELSEKYGFHCEMLYENRDFNFLVRLQKY